MASPVKPRHSIIASSLKDLRSPVFWRDVVCEMLVCTVLMVIVIFALITNNTAHYKISTTHLGLFAGFLVYLLIEGYGPISGAHMNPCGSFSLFLAGHISLARALLYIVVQTTGSAIGSGLGYGLTPNATSAHFHAFNPVNAGLSPFQGVIIEAIFAFNLIFVALSCHDTQHRPNPCAMPALPIAWCIGIGIMAAGTHTGGLMNPIVAFGPALLAMDFRNHWVYWLGPFIGGPLAVGTYKLMIFIKLKYEPPTPMKNIDDCLSNKGKKEELRELLEELLQSHKEFNKMSVADA